MRVKKGSKPKQTFTEDQSDSLAKALLYLMGLRLEREAGRQQDGPCSPATRA